MPLKPQASLDAHGAVLVVQDVPIGNTQPALQDDDLAARAQVGQVELARAIFQRQGQETRGRVDPLDAPVVVARVLAAVRPVQRLERMNLGAFVDEAGGPGRLTGQGGGQLGLGLLLRGLCGGRRRGSQGRRHRRLKLRLSASGFLGAIFFSRPCMKSMILLYPFNYLEWINRCIGQAFAHGIGGE